MASCQSWFAAPGGRATQEAPVSSLPAPGECDQGGAQDIQGVMVEPELQSSCLRVIKPCSILAFRNLGRIHRGNDLTGMIPSMLDDSQ